MNHLDLSATTPVIGPAMTISDGAGPGLDAIAFGAFDGPLGPALENSGHRRFHLAGKLELAHCNGRTPAHLRLVHAAPP